jgi:hypothetical protein
MQPLQPSAQLQSKAPAPSQHPPQTSHNRHQRQNQPIHCQRPASALASVRRSAAQDPQRQQFKVNPVPSRHMAGAPTEAAAAQQLAMHVAEVAPPFQSHHHVPVKPASSPSASTCAAVTDLPRNVTPAQVRQQSTFVLSPAIFKSFPPTSTVPQTTNHTRTLTNVHAAAHAPARRPRRLPFGGLEPCGFAGWTLRL